MGYQNLFHLPEEGSDHSVIDLRSSSDMGPPNR
jgi:hypothetical protein